MFFLKSIKLKSFRCVKTKEYSFNNKINIICGKNATGKTSIVEAIHVLGVCKSHRTTSDNELVNDGSMFYSLSAIVSDNDKLDDEITILYTQNRKKITLNNKMFKNMSEYIGYFKVVMFCPEDIVLVNGTPKDKRRFLDLNISAFDREYIYFLMDYKRILKGRNEYLKNTNIETIDYVLLKTYSDKLVELGREIIRKRRMFISELNNTYKEKVNIISGGTEEAFIEYLPNCDENLLWKNMQNNIKYDIINKTTFVGPHKDNFIIKINNMDSSIYASQGQKKTLTLGIKLALVDVIKKYDDKIIVILDDVFGELDCERQNNIMKLITINHQIFITTTSVDGLIEEVLKNSKIINIEKEGI